MDGKYDYLIVGQGLAGTLLAHELKKKGAKIYVVDNTNGPSASKVAAGIFNPITGKRFVKTWLADEIYPNLIAYYQQLEADFGRKFLNISPIFRPADNAKEQNLIIDLAEKPQIEQFVKYESSPNEITAFTEAAYGGMVSKIGGWLDVPKFLQIFKDYFIEKSIYSNQIFDYSAIDFSGNELHWQKVKFGKIIFCEGYAANQNPFFNWLPFNAVKGETINITANLPLQKHVLSKGIFVVPIGKNQFKVGATYNWVDKTNNITAEGKNELENKLKKLLKTDFEIIEQQAGIRPATVDRRPFVGLHPNHPNIGIFNGLGTKGVSLGPFFAAEFADFLINKKQVNNEVIINRFFRYI